MAMNAGDKGEWAKSVVCSALLRAGLPIYRAVSPAAAQQLIVVNPPPCPVVLTKLDVKCGQHRTTKDGEHLVIVSGARSMSNALAVVTPDGEALFGPGPLDGYLPEWDTLARFRLDGSTIIRLDGVSRPVTMLGVEPYVPYEIDVPVTRRATT